MFAGPGSGPLFVAAAAWDGLASELASSAASFRSVTSDLASGSWLGPSSAAMMAVASQYAAFLSAAAVQAEQAAGQASVAAGAFEAALAATVQPAVVAANRGLMQVLANTNWLGAERSGDRGHRGRIRADVGSGRGGDVGLPLRRVGGGSAIGALATAAARPRQQPQQRPHHQPQPPARRYGPRRWRLKPEQPVQRTLWHGSTDGNSNSGPGNAGSQSVGSGDTGNNGIGFGSVKHRPRKYRQRGLRVRAYRRSSVGLRRLEFG